MRNGEEKSQRVRPGNILGLFGFAEFGIFWVRAFGSGVAAPALRTLRHI